ncbi:hypothetical protein HYV86_07715 [Candidatus Woesearchaeota archaeon]|nr:hypothetical protein [Candidatus Woesearchaeota archaeon]
MDLERVRKVALTVRKDFEQGTINSNELRDLYQQYTCIEDIELFLLRAQELFPTLNCGLATVYLQKKLGGKIVQGRYREYNHTFLLLDNLLLVDITSDQYGGPEVYVGSLIYPWRIKRNLTITL